MIDLYYLGPDGRGNVVAEFHCGGRVYPFTAREPLSIGDFCRAAKGALEQAKKGFGLGQVVDTPRGRAEIVAIDISVERAAVRSKEGGEIDLLPFAQLRPVWDTEDPWGKRSTI